LDKLKNKNWQIYSYSINNKKIIAKFIDQKLREEEIILFWDVISNIIYGLIGAAIGFGIIYGVVYLILSFILSIKSKK